jgi:uncharacterized membrane protein YccC
MPHAGLVALTLALTVTLIPMALVGAFRPSYRVASITAIIVLLSSRTQQVGALRSAVDRVLDIAVGVVVALAVSLLVVPARAHALLTETAANVLELIGTGRTKSTAPQNTGDGSRRLIPGWPWPIEAAPSTRWC